MKQLMDEKASVT